VKKIPAFPALVLLLATAFASDCRQPLDADTLERLQLGWSPDVQLQPGQSHQFELAILSTFAPSTKIPACAAWSVEPAAQGATIDSKGLLKIAAKTPSGTRFNVTADIEKGRAKRQAFVIVYTPQTQPLVGLWEQTAQFDCESGRQMESFPVIHELDFRAAGRFSVTWTPFEVYRDYWGEYVSHARAKTITLKIAGGNFVPQDFQGSGTYKVIDDHTMELSRIFLGSREKGTPETTLKPLGKQCRYVFKLNDRSQ
jgi:hypothetical protein